MPARDFRYHLLSIGVNREANGATVRRPSAMRSASRGRSHSSATGAPSATAASPAPRRRRPRSTRISRTARVSTISISCSSTGAATSSPSIPRRRARARRRRAPAGADRGHLSRRRSDAPSRAALADLPDDRRPIVLASCAPDSRIAREQRERLLHRRAAPPAAPSARPGTRTLDLLDAFNRATDEAVGRTGRDRCSVQRRRTTPNPDPRADHSPV